MNMGEGLYVNLDHNPKIWIIYGFKLCKIRIYGEIVFGMILAGNILESKKTKI